MKRRYIFNIVFVLIAVILIQVLVKRAPKGEGEIVEAFKKTEFEVTSSEITATAMLGNQYLNDNKREAALKEFAALLGMDENYTLKINETATKEEMIIFKEGKNAKIELKIVTYVKQLGGVVKEVTNYFIVNMNLYNNIDSVMYYKNLIEKELQNKNISVDTVINISGEKAGKIGQNDRKKIIGQLMEVIDAKLVDEHSYGEVYNSYGYTGIIGQYLVANGNKVNVDTAITYDEEQDTTRLYLATPIITVEY